ncbi:hypothetical protein FIBSPDRAFT_1052820 [Athelia psychrophila]|uniref:PCI domain-containing protein n=1 Tax=Athelia psychrophila TaxID=1759441 RepID=A0A165WKH1_9AGAM|nr:hypothetical protein FIBSPDRAFT_1052820 [Fibularhizoctonia sp. CBS 109695]
MSESEVATMAEYDVHKTIIPYLDRHLAFPLLNHLAELAISPVADVQAAQYELAKEFAVKRETALSTNERLQQEAQAVLDVIENPDVAQALRHDKAQNLQYLKDNYDLTPAQITTLYTFRQLQLTYGNYSGTADYLYHFCVLSTDVDLLVSARGASSPPTSSPESATSHWRNSTPFATLSTRGSMHTGVVVGRDAAGVQQDIAGALESTFLSPTYLATIQTACLWILRYLAAAAVLARRSPPSTATPAAPTSTRVKHALKEIVKVIQTEEHRHTDPPTRFLNFLYIDFDFEAAQRELASASAVVQDDFFLGEFKTEFVEAVRGLVSKVYVRIHQRIDIGDLSKWLNLGPEEGEKWIADLIRETRMGADAKIDLEKNVIEINRPPLPVYKSVIEKTRGLACHTREKNGKIKWALAFLDSPQRTSEYLLYHVIGVMRDAGVHSATFVTGAKGSLEVVDNIKGIRAKPPLADVPGHRQLVLAYQQVSLRKVRHIPGRSLRVLPDSSMCRTGIEAIMHSVEDPLPTSHGIWIAAVRLCKQQGDDTEIIDTTIELGLKEAERCESEGSPLVCEAVEKATAAMEIEEEDQLNTDSLTAVLDRAVQHCPQAELLWLMSAKKK